MKSDLRILMLFTICILLSAVLVQGCAFVPWPEGKEQGTGVKRTVSSYEQWAIYRRNSRIKNMDTSGAASQLTALNYAYGGMTADLKCSSFDPEADYKKRFGANEAVNGVADTDKQPLRGNLNQLKQLKAKYPSLQVLISLGGWTLSAHFSDAALPQHVAAYVQSCIDLYIKGNIAGMPPGVAAGIFDGLDIDWEYPGAPGRDGNVFRAEDTQNFTGLLAEFQKQLADVSARTHKHYLLTMAASAVKEKYSLLQLNRLSKYLDWINVMTYEYNGAWAKTTNIMAPLFCDPRGPEATVNLCVDATIRGYLAAGVPADKINLGIPDYGRGWTNVPNVNNGLYQTSPTIIPAPGIDDVGINDYSVLAALPGYKGYRSQVTQGYWIFNGTTLWSFDDPKAVEVKMQYAKRMGLGGACSRAIDRDTSNATLLKAIARGLSS